MKKIPFGSVGSFYNLITQNYIYVDRTLYIEKLEELNKKHLLFLRPRRFGKSLFISVLHHYYALDHKDKFEQLFGDFYIGKHPTELRNSYLVLKFNFSGISTMTMEKAYQGFLVSVRVGVKNFLITYNFPKEYIDQVNALSSPEGIIKELWLWMEYHKNDKQVYVMIDEYDHFTNELVAYHFEDFKKIVGRNGWVRKFYETLKIGADTGIVDRTFITGVTPITLDSLTSGFSNATDISTDIRFVEMMGFTHEEVHQLLQYIEVPNVRIEDTITDLKSWYNGYLFHKNAKNAVYNSEMVLYFLDAYLVENKYPEQLLAKSVATDYHKIRSMFRVGHKEKENIKTMRKILADNEITASLTQMFNFEEDWQEHHFVSLLYYLGFLTIKDSDLSQLIFTIPNYVIRELYFQYFVQITLEESQLNTHQIDVQGKVLELAKYNDMKPVIELTESVLTQLSAHHDRAYFNETHVKAIFTSWFYTAGVYHIFSELEVVKNQKNKQKGRIDLLLTRREPYGEKVPYQFIFELKYLKQSQVGLLEDVEKAAITQLKGYLKDDKVKNLKDLKAYVVIFVVNKARIIAVN